MTAWREYQASLLNAARLYARLRNAIRSSERAPRLSEAVRTAENKGSEHNRLSVVGVVVVGNGDGEGSREEVGGRLFRAP